jgi:hypothetical protein
MWTKRIIVWGHVCFTGLFAWALNINPGWPPLSTIGATVVQSVQETSLGSTWSVYVIFSLLVACSFGFSLKPHVYTRVKAKEMRLMLAFEQAAPTHNVTETLETLVSRAYESKLTGSWFAFAVAMSLLSASYFFLPMGVILLQGVARQGWFTGLCHENQPYYFVRSSLPDGSCLYPGFGNTGAIAFFAATVPLTGGLSFAIQLLQHKFDTLFLVIQTHLQWLTDSVPVAGAQCEATHERMRAWWELREFLVKEKLPVLYRFASPGFAFIIVLNAVLALALVLEDLQIPGSWRQNPPEMVIFVHCLFITAFLMKSCWRLYTCAALQASHTIKLQQLKGGQLAMTKLINSAGGEAGDAQAVSAGMQQALVFAEEVEARVAIIRLGDETQKILGIAVTPQNLLLIIGYFGSGLVTLLSRS